MYGRIFPLLQSSVGRQCSMDMGHYSRGFGVLRALAYEAWSSFMTSLHLNPFNLSFLLQDSRILHNENNV